LEAKVYFLIDFAVDLCFQDLVEEGIDESLFLTPERVIQGIEVDEDLRKDLYEVGLSLGVPDAENTVGTLQVLVELLRRSLHYEKLRKAGTSPEMVDESVLKYLRETVPLGFSTGDATLDDICRLFRLLYLKDLKKLQVTINNIIIQLQTQTANPKTDPSRARVGR